MLLQPIRGTLLALNEVLGRQSGSSAPHPQWQPSSEPYQEGSHVQVDEGGSSLFLFPPPRDDGLDEAPTKGRIDFANPAAKSSVTSEVEGWEVNTLLNNPDRLVSGLGLGFVAK